MSDNPDNTADLVPHLLRQIQGTLAAMQDEMKTDRMAIRQEMQQLRGELREDFRKEIREEGERIRVDLRREMRERFGDLAALYAGAHRDHERRITEIELRVEKLENPPR
jgi:ribosome recycling factor